MSNKGLSYLQLEAKIKRLTELADLSNEVETILDLPTQYATPWINLVGTPVPKGKLVAHQGIKYLVMQSVTPIESQTPSMQGMLAIYKPYQGKRGYPWIYGEYSAVGFTRYHNGKLYEAIQDPGANIYAPDLLPAIWQEVTND